MYRNDSFLRCFIDDCQHVQTLLPMVPHPLVKFSHRDLMGKRLWANQIAGAPVSVGYLAVTA